MLTVPQSDWKPQIRMEDTNRIRSVHAKKRTADVFALWRVFRLLDIKILLIFCPLQGNCYLRQTCAAYVRIVLAEENFDKLFGANGLFRDANGSVYFLQIVRMHHRI